MSSISRNWTSRWSKK